MALVVELGDHVIAVHVVVDLKCLMLSSDNEVIFLVWVHLNLSVHSNWSQDSILLLEESIEAILIKILNQYDGLLVWLIILKSDLSKSWMVKTEHISLHPWVNSVLSNHTEFKCLKEHFYDGDCSKTGMWKLLGFFH